MKMLKTLALAALAPTLIKAVEDGYEYVCNYFNNLDETPKSDIPKTEVKVIKPNTPDRTVITSNMIRRIIQEHNSYKLRRRTTTGSTCSNIKELTKHLNKEFNINKSTSSYSKIWNKK